MAWIQSDIALNYNYMVLTQNERNSGQGISPLPAVFDAIRF